MLKNIYWKYWRILLLIRTAEISRWNLLKICTLRFSFAFILKPYTCRNIYVDHCMNQKSSWPSRNNILNTTIRITHSLVHSLKRSPFRCEKFLYCRHSMIAVGFMCSLQRRNILWILLYCETTGQLHSMSRSCSVLEKLIKFTMSPTYSVGNSTNYPIAGGLTNSYKISTTLLNNFRLWNTEE